MLALTGWGVFSLWPKENVFAVVPKNITLSLNGLEYIFLAVTEDTVGAFLEASGLALSEKESVFPPAETVMTPGMKLFLNKTHTVTVEVDGKKQSYPVLALSVDEALLEAGIALDEDDIIKPERKVFASEDMVIEITRVTIEEKVVEKTIAFEKKINEDDRLSWRKKSVTQRGEVGLDRLIYRVSSYDGKEVSRKLIRTERVKDPVPEVITQGTYVKLGKSHSGGASWYAWTGTMAAANPWLPKGSYVKVTNTENGKSVIVVINDRGPFVPGRIIDLDKVAFAKIASVGAGVIHVKMEEIVN